MRLEAAEEAAKAGHVQGNHEGAEGRCRVSQDGQHRSRDHERRDADIGDLKSKSIMIRCTGLFREAESVCARQRG